MSQRFFITAEATYESLRQRLDAALGYPNALGSSVIQPPIHAPRDAYRRVLIAVDSALQGYATIIAAIESLVATDAMEELDEATYLAAASSQIPIVVTLAEVTTTANYGFAVLGDTPSEAFLAQLATNSFADAIDAVGGLPFATANVPGAIAIGTGLAIDGNGVVSVTGNYTLPTATATVLGGVKVGSGVTITNGVISVFSGAYADLTGKPSLATVATTGSYTDLSNKPSIPAAATKSFVKFTPADNQPPATNFATLDTRNSVLVLEFDAATDESAVFVGYIPEGTTLTNGLKVRLSWMADTATSGNVRWGVQFEADGTDLDSDSFDTATLVTSAANGTSGIETVAEITATSIDSLAAGDRFRLRVYRDADDATNDTMTGDAQLVAVEVQVA